MRKVINGVRYDTEKSTKIATADNGYFPGDIQWWRETLYRSQAGKFFLFGEGGPTTRYCRRTGSNSWGGGQDIHAMGKGEALQWLEEAEIDVDDEISAFFDGMIHNA